jgi:hypothetical protein
VRGADGPGGLVQGRDLRAQFAFGHLGQGQAGVQQDLAGAGGPAAQFGAAVQGEDGVGVPAPLGDLGHGRGAASDDHRVRMPGQDLHGLDHGLGAEQGTGRPHLGAGQAGARGWARGGGGRCRRAMVCGGGAGR